MNWPWQVPQGSRAELQAYESAAVFDLAGAEQARSELVRNVARIAELQRALWAEDRRALLVVLQGLDTSGKDGVIRAVLSGVNPQGVRVHAFARPTPQELDRDFLWRVHRVVPARGEIGVFNRSHYEDVLVARVQGLAPAQVIEQRYAAINDFERLLCVHSGGYVTLLKLFLHVSRAEQRRRLRERLSDPRKNWKMKPEDLEVHRRWDEYQEAYARALARCSTPWAPWYVLPADRKWARNALASRLIARAMEELAPQFPAPRADLAALQHELDGVP